MDGPSDKFFKEILAFTYSISYEKFHGEKLPFHAVLASLNRFFGKKQTLTTNAYAVLTCLGNDRRNIGIYENVLGFVIGCEET